MAGSERYRLLKSIRAKILWRESYRAIVALGAAFGFFMALAFGISALRTTVLGETLGWHRDLCFVPASKLG